MNLQSLRPAGDFARQFGVKALIYGPPGTGKTPLLNSAPRPVLLACEPGLLSMRTSTVPTYCAPTAKEADEFFQWWFGSNETRNFDTLGVDSVSELASHFLKAEEKAKKHGLQAYGAMAERTLAHLDALYFQPTKHIYLIAKQGIVQTPYGEMCRPEFPGKELNREVPHKFDEILHVGPKNVPGHGQVRAIQTFNTSDIIARDRSGRLNSFEPCDLAALFQKCMS